MTIAHVSPISLAADPFSSSYDLAMVDAHSLDLGRLFQNTASSKPDAPRYAVRWMPQIYEVHGSTAVPPGQLGQGAFVSPSVDRAAPAPELTSLPSPSMSASSSSSLDSVIDPARTYSPLVLDDDDFGSDGIGGGDDQTGVQPDLSFEGGVITEHDALFGGHMAGSNLLPVTLGQLSSPAFFETTAGAMVPSPFATGGGMGYVSDAGLGHPDFAGLTVAPSMAQAGLNPATAGVVPHLQHLQHEHQNQYQQPQPQQQPSPVSTTPDLDPSHSDESDTTSDGEGDAELKTAHSDDEYVPSPPPTARATGGKKRRSTVSSSHNGASKKAKLAASANGGKTIACPYEGVFLHRRELLGCLLTGFFLC
jgi:hypothetical protein